MLPIRGVIENSRRITSEFRVLLTNFEFLKTQVAFLLFRRRLVTTKAHHRSSPPPKLATTLKREKPTLEEPETGSEAATITLPIKMIRLIRTLAIFLLFIDSPQTFLTLGPHSVCPVKYLFIGVLKFALFAFRNTGIESGKSDN